MKNRVTAVLPAHNNIAETERCLEALDRGTLVPDIIVVNDGPDMAAAERIREKHPQIHVISLPARTGYSHTVNTGLRLVQTQYAFVLRPDLFPGRHCLERLLLSMEREDVFCAVPSFSPGTCKNGKTGSSGKVRKGHAAAGDRETLAVPDGCALYRMKVLEEIGWMDERHFEGLEAFDLSLRAALDGYRTVCSAKAFVRSLPDRQDPCAAEAGGSGLRHGAGEAGRDPGRKKGEKADLFHIQLAAGNGAYTFYKNIPGALRFVEWPLRGTVRAAQLFGFSNRRAPQAYRMAMTRVRALRSMEQERREALSAGVLWPESLYDASFLGMDERTADLYPLFLAEKQPAMLSRLPQYAYIHRRLVCEWRAVTRLLSDGKSANISAFV